MMTAVATYINESKRKKEIVLKYRDSGQDEKLSQKISRFTMHSVAKKSSRIGMLLKTSLGMAPTVCSSFIRSQPFFLLRYKIKVSFVPFPRLAIRLLTKSRRASVNCFVSSKQPSMTLPRSANSSRLQRRPSTTYQRQLPRFTAREVNFR